MSLLASPVGATPRYTIGVDIGGTFTDVVVIASDGEILASKAPTTPDDFSGGVLDAIREAAAAAGLGMAALLGRTDLIKHGSTVATNALITRAGASVGFITTRGFEDTTLIMRAVGRVDGLPDEEVRRVTSITKPEPLVQPELIRGVPERIDAEGNVVVPLDLDAVRVAVHDLIGDAGRPGVDAIAVSLLHSWRNPEHERAIRGIVEELDPGGHVFCSLGSDLSQVAGEYARANTAIANAFVGPTVRRYLANLEASLRDDGFAGRILVMQGNGGLTSHALASPISTLQSGPAGGMLASATMSDKLGHRRAITADMGGTSFDVGIVDGGYWRYADEPIFGRFRILQPITDIISIGAGGGTMARVDEATGRLIVGPQSAGARPGPVCYGLGGEVPTVTDADLVLGYIDPAYFLGGRRTLDLDRARAAIDERLARRLGLDPVEAAAGIVRIVDSKMSDLIRREVIRSGRLPQDFVLYAFGGASPVHAVGYARDLGVPEIIVFPTSPVFSAFGVAAADLVHTRVATRAYALPLPAADLNADLDALEASLADELGQDGLDGAPEFRRYVTLQFRRQSSGEEIRLPWDRFTDERIAQLPSIFVEHYERLYGKGVAYLEAGLDLARLRVDAVGRVAKPELRPGSPGSGRADGAQKGERAAWFGHAFQPTPVYDEALLGPGARLAGPAIVESPFTTVVVPPGASLTVDPYRNLVIRP
ncbi:MAG: hydantoinase/oxoprolinase family protein [Candidatus Limnocylindrales bacterium]|nr:hydantoinase/oxoprolinase family protein [Candidatus Limnocylindrales bacterium]